MKKIIFFILCSLSLTRVLAQTVVTDPTSVAQRVSIFLEEMEEAVSSRLELIEQVENTRKTYELSVQAAEKLREVSEFIKTSAVACDIVSQGTSVTNKILSYKQQLSEMHSLSEEERYSVYCTLIEMGKHVADKVKEGMEMTQSKENGGEFTDYERLQMLKDVREELEWLNSSVETLFTRCVKENAFQDLSAELNSLLVNSMTFSFK
ncbi:MAG: hypothetical protein J5808_05330 [Paludibacteraceae bacterium]|nr:hypothetical protein [Paludibacteraceae bacterium]